MEYTYKIIKTLSGEVIKCTDSEGNESWVPQDSANSDYQEYLASLEATELEAE
jgi:hypothetical protein